MRMRSGNDGDARVQARDGHGGDVFHDGHASRRDGSPDGDDAILDPRNQSRMMTLMRMRMRMMKRKTMNALFFHASHENVDHGRI